MEREIAWNINSTINKERSKRRTVKRLDDDEGHLSQHSFLKIDTSMHCSPGSRKTRKRAELAREEALTKAREKSRVEEEERQAGLREKCEKRLREDMQFEQFLA